MAQKCVTWKQPDGTHFNGFCTNRFRLTTPPSGVKVGSGCQLCVHPTPREPPQDCGGCSTLDEQEWPLSYTIRGAITAPADTAGTYVSTATNATGTATRTDIVLDFAWSEIANLFDGGRLLATYSSPEAGDCSWRYCINEVYAYKRGSAFNTDQCGVPRNRPQSLDGVGLLSRVVSPQYAKFYGTGSVPANAADFTFPQCIPVEAFGALFAGSAYNWYPSFVAQWPDGYGTLSGTDLRNDTYSATTSTPIFDDCPSAGSFGGNVISQVLQISFSVSPEGDATLLLVVGPCVRLLNITYYNTTTGLWARTFDEIAPFDDPVSEAPDEPYGVVYRGTVDCQRKDYFLLTKDSGAQPDTLSVYPSTIELVGA